MEKNWQAGEYVWAKLKGYRWWPAVIQDQKELPELIIKNKPKLSSGLHAVLFFGSQDYAWLGKDSLLPFKENYSTHSAGGKKSALFVKAVHEAAVLTGLAKATEPKQSFKRVKKDDTVEHTIQAAEAKPSVPKRRGRPSKDAVSKKGNKNNEDLIDQEITALITDSTEVVQEATPYETFGELRRQLQKAALKDKMKDPSLIHGILDHLEVFDCDEHMIMESKVLKVLRHILKFEPVEECEDSEENEKYINYCQEIIERSKAVYKRLRSVCEAAQEQSSTNDKDEHGVVANVTQDLFAQLEHPEVEVAQIEAKEFKDAAIPPTQSEDAEANASLTEDNKENKTSPVKELTSTFDSSSLMVPLDLLPGPVEASLQEEPKIDEDEELAADETGHHAKKRKHNGDTIIENEMLAKLDNTHISEDLENTSAKAKNGAKAANLSGVEAVTNSSL